MAVMIGNSQKSFTAAVLALIFTAPIAFSQSAKAGTSFGGVLTKIADVPMPGPAVRFDYQSLDAKHERLYISHMNANQLVVFDTKTQQVVANLDGFTRVHGVLAVPEIGRVYASVTGDRKVAAVDMQHAQDYRNERSCDLPRRTRVLSSGQADLRFG